MSNYLETLSLRTLTGTLIWLCSSPLFILLAQTENDLEARLAKEKGRARLATLVSLSQRVHTQNPKKVLAFGLESLDLLRKYPNPETELTVLMEIAIAYRKLGEFRHALDFGKRASSLASMTGDRERLANIQHEMGLAHEETGNYSMALDGTGPILKIYDLIISESSELGSRIFANILIVCLVLDNTIIEQNKIWSLTQMYT